MNDDGHDTASQRWARLRFAIIGPLLAAPPKPGRLRAALEELAKRSWKHPSTSESVCFAVSTIERWYYRARNEQRDPVGVLRRRVRKDVGETRSLGDVLRRALEAQHKQHPSWSTQLHYDNLVALAKETALGCVPSYTTVRRYMRAHALVRMRPRSRRQTEGTERAAQRLERLEVRSYESTHVHGLWHLDFHQGSRKVLERGAWWRAQLFGVLDDRSRLCCHLQWYLDETREALVHGLSQAMQKSKLPRGLMTDGGAAMRAEETWRGLEVLGVVHELTLPESPYQNGKQESFWGQVEGRLLPMLEGVIDLDLRMLNEATQAWVELEYNKKIHSEIGTSPLRRYLEGPDVGRPCPPSETLRNAFRRKVGRTQRRSDGTIQLEGQRFELPSRLRQMTRVVVRYAKWDLGRVDV
ncbi:MAG: IS481 family transposase, partial [Myxococcota bacterium]